MTPPQSKLNEEKLDLEKRIEEERQKIKRDNTHQ